MKCRETPPPRGSPRAPDGRAAGTGQSVVDRPEDRSDCSIVKVPGSSIAFITGHRGESLRAIERESGTRGAAPDSALPRDLPPARARRVSTRARARPAERAPEAGPAHPSTPRRFCFTDGERNSGKESENLLVFSFSRSARDHAADIIEDRIREHKRMGGRGGGGGGGYRDDRGGGGRGYRDDRRDDRRDYDRRDRDRRDRSRSRDRRDRRSRSRDRHDRRRRDDSEDSYRRRR